jgi:zinc protease
MLSSPNVPPADYDLRASLPSLIQHQLPNGLKVGLLPNHRSPVVATALVYNVGARHETPAEAGAAHFLEHMMFKGSTHYGAGEIDRLTRALGGSNNAFTSQDLTLYYFTFAADRWREALAIEADRMAGLNLEVEEVDSERQVILEELAMYEDEPWEALEQKVSTTLFAPHPYGRPVIGTRSSLAGIDSKLLRDFHHRHYRPANAVLIVAGDLDESAFDHVAEAFGDLPSRPQPADGEEVSPPALQEDASAARRIESRRIECHRIECHYGEIARFLLAIPTPAATHPDHPLLLLLTAVLGFGRASRLNHALVDSGQLCMWVSAELQDTREPGLFACALEVLPGVRPSEVETAVLEILDQLCRQGPSAEEIQRARKILLADWLFGHEKVHQQAFLMGTALTLFDLEHPWKYFDRLQHAKPEELRDVARRYLRPQRGVIGWSLPTAGASS